MLQDLLDQHGPDAVLAVYPYEVRNGTTTGWVLTVDGADLSGVGVRVELPHRGDVAVMFLSCGEEIELDEWSTSEHPYGRPVIVRRLGDLVRGRG